MKKILFSILTIILITSHLAGQTDSLRRKVYQVNHSIEFPLTVVTSATALVGFIVVDKKPALDSMTVIRLDPNDVNRFDRSAISQDAGFAPTARSISDFTLGFSQALPFLLFLDKEIRKDWGNLLLMYIETQAMVGNLYSWGCVVYVDRIRPLSYNPDVPFSQRIENRNRNAFYSGHTSMSTSASFFAAKVYCDYHPELGNRKFLVYSLALIPSLTTGYFRYRGLKHFPTDVLTGLAVGATAGILNPHIHKKINSNLVIAPFAGKINGLALSYKF